MSRRMMLISLCMLFALFASPVFTVKSEGLNQGTDKPEVLKVGIYLIRAGSLDTSTGAIDVDFYIEFICPSTCGDKTDFEIINGITKAKPILLADEGSDTVPTFRVAATVYQDVNLRQYPFDSHDVKIIIEPSNYDKTALIYESNDATTAIDPNVFILGWAPDKKPVARITEHYYEAWNLYYTRYEFTTHLSKPPLAGWLKGLLPAIFIVLGTLFALFITTKNIGNRVAIVTSSLIASVLYHLNFTSRIPPIGYLTFGDYVMIINYIVILIALALTIWMIRVDSAPDKPAPTSPKPASRKKKGSTPEPEPAPLSKQELIARVNKIELIAIPSLWLVLHLVNAAIHLWL